MAVPCPGCKASVRFEHPGSWAVVCASCAALVLRDGTRHPGSASQMDLVEDISPLRVGCAGQVEGKYFRVTGRVRVEGQRGYRNFWSIKGDTPYAWLLQAFGTYAMVAMDQAPVPPTVFRKVSPGGELKMDGGYQLEMLDNQFRYAWEGEIMQPLPIPWDIEVEAGDPSGGRLLILVDRSKEACMLKGMGLNFPDLRLENPPTLAQWS